MRYICFFFQAEDGIRDIGVTGVQTCALPISGVLGVLSMLARVGTALAVGLLLASTLAQSGLVAHASAEPAVVRAPLTPSGEEEDRKSVVQGKSVDLGGRRIITKKSDPESST